MAGLMAKRLPPLSSLRVYEAAARHLSFTKAAAELNITQAAVSHQIKALETELGQALFTRLNRGLILTEAGARYFPTIEHIFEKLREATEQVKLKQETHTLTVSTLASFAARWLVPRLGKFLRLYPEMDVRISPSLQPVDFKKDDVDIAIRYGLGKYPGLCAEHLFQEDLFPVCSPELLKGEHPLKTPADLNYHTLLHDEGRGEWRPWLMAAGVENVDASRGTFYSDSSMAIQAAVGGQGVVLASNVLAADELANGNLLRPFDLKTTARFAYYVVYPQKSANDKKIAAFRNWLLQEAKDS